MALRDVRSREHRTEPVEAMDKYAAWWIGAVLRFDAIPKIQNDLNFASAPSWATVQERCASSGQQCKHRTDR
jgi:hypothetical protein